MMDLGDGFFLGLLDSLNFDSIPVNVVVPVTAVPERGAGQRRERRAVPGAART
jgi:small subunit ribosomal protein S17e